MAKKQLNLEGVDVSVFKKKLDLSGVDMSVFSEDVKKKEDTTSPSLEEPSTSVGKSEAEFQKWIQTDPSVVAWREEFKKQYGEEPDINNSEYDYRGAFEAGIVPEKNETDGRYHWGSIGVGGKDLKSENHPTRWKSEYMKASGVNPDESNISYEEAVKEYPELTTFNPIVSNTNEPKLVEELEYTAEDLDTFSKFDVNPRMLMGATAEDRKKYVDYKKKQSEYTVTEDERNDAKEALTFVESELEDAKQEWKERPKIKKPTTPRVSFFGDIQYETKEDEQKASVLRDKKRLLEESKHYLNAVANGDKQNGAERFWEGAKTLDVANFMSLGIKDLLEGIDLATIANKLDEQGEEALSEDEKDVLILNNIRNQAEQAAMEDRAFAVGSGIAETVPFIADMVVTSGAGSAIRKGVFKGTAKLVKNKAARKLVSNLADATARAYLFPSTYEKAVERAAPEVGFTDEFEPIITEQGEDVFEALGKAGAENMVEIFSEGAVGAGLSKFIGRATKRGVKLMGNTRLSNIFDAVQSAGKNSPILKMSAIQDPITEFGEEIFAGIVQPIVTGDGSPKDFFEYENMIRTAMTVGIMSSAMATPSYVVGARNAIRINKGRDIFNSMSDTEKEVFSEMAQTDNMDEATEKMKLIHMGLIQSKTDGSTDEDVVSNAVKESNTEMARLNDYYASVKKAQAEARKIKTPTYQIGDRVFRDKESFFKEIDKNLGNKNGLPFVEIRNDSGAEKELQNKFDSKVEPIEEKEEKPTVAKKAQVELTSEERKVRVEKIKSDNAELDAQIKEAQTRLGLETTPDIDVSDDTELTLEQIENDEQVPNVFVEKASNELYDRYNELETMKQSDNRVYTTEQIESMQEFLGEEITKLEEYAAKQKETGEFIGKAKVSETTQKGTGEVVKPSEKLVENGNDGQAEVQGKLQEQQGEKQGVSEPEVKTEQASAEKGKAIEKAGEEEITPTDTPKLVTEPLSPEKGVTTPTEEKVAEITPISEIRKQRFAEIDAELGAEIENLAESLGIVKKLTGEQRAKLAPTVVRITKLLAEKYTLKGQELVDEVIAYFKNKNIELDDELIKTVQDAEKEQSGQVRTESTETGKGQGQRDSDMPKVDGTKLQDREKAEEKIGVRQFGKKVTESTVLPTDVKEDIKKRGITYVRRGRKVTQREANEVISIYSESGDMAEIKAEIFNPSVTTMADTRITIAVAYVNHMIEKSKSELDPIKAAEYRRNAADVLDFYVQKSTLVAQELEGMKVWHEAIGKNPEFIVETVRSTVDKNNTEFYEKYAESINSAKKIIDEFLNSEEFKSKYGKKKAATTEQRKQQGISKIASGVNKLATLRGIRLQAVSENEVKENEFDALKEIADGILDVGIASIQELIAEIKVQTRKYFSPSEIERVAARLAKETDAKNRLKKKTEKIVLDKTDEEKLIDKLYKSMVIAKRSDLKKLVADNIDLFQRQGALDDRSFRELVAKAVGRYHVSDKQLNAVEKAAKTINDAKNIEENVDKLFNDYIQAVEDKDKDLIRKLNNEVKRQLKEYKKAMLKAGIASSEIGSIFADSPTLVKMFATFIQGNLLTPASLKVNLVANLFVTPLRLSRNIVASGFDWLISQMAIGLNRIGINADRIRDPRWKEAYEKMFSIQRTFMSTGINKGLFSGTVEGLGEGLVQMWMGQAQDDVYRRDISKALHPLEAWYDIYHSLTGDEKLRTKEIIQKSVEGTFGVPPEIIFRFLNLGDKPFRKAAEKSRLSELAAIKKKGIIKDFLTRVGTDNGLTGKELSDFVSKPDKQSSKDAEEYYEAWKKKFMIRPDEESWEEARKAGLEAVYQNDNVLSDAIKQVSLAASERAKTGIDSIDRIVSSFMRLAFVSNIPFIKTPSNVVLEALDYGFPPIPYVKGIYHLLQGNRREFVKNMGTALTGTIITELVGSLFGLGILGLAQGGGEDEPSKIVPTKVKSAEYYYRPPYYLNNRAMADMWGNMFLGTNKDLSFKAGDTMSSYTRYGLVSSILMAQAEGYAGMTPEEIRNLPLVTRQMSFLRPILKSSLDQSYVKGISAVMNAINGSEYEQDSYLVGITRALGASVIPNTYRAYQQAKDNYIRDTKAATLEGGKKVSQMVVNDFNSSYNIGKMPPPRVNIWGEDVERYQDGNKPIFRIFDITKKREYGNGFGLEIFDLYQKTQNNDVLPPDVTNRVKIYDQYVKVDGWLYHDMAKYAARKHKELVKSVITSNGWRTVPDDASKVEALKGIYGGRYNDASFFTRSDFAKEFINANFEQFKKLYISQHGQAAYDEYMRKAREVRK